MSYNSVISAPPKRRAGDVETSQPTNVSIVETVQSTAEQAPEETNFSPVNGNVPPPDPCAISSGLQKPDLRERCFSMTV